MVVGPMAVAWLLLGVARPDAGAAQPPGQHACGSLEKCLAAVETLATDGPGVSGPEDSVAKALQAYGRRATPGLLALLKSQRRAVRKLAAYTLRDLDGLSEAEVPELVAALRSEERRVGKECRSRWSR